MRYTPRMVNATLRFDEFVIDIRLDNVFKAVFTRDTPASRGALRALISAVIGRPVEIIAIQANEPPVDSLTDRQIRFDINCRIDGRQNVNIEMTICPHSYEPARIEYHLARLHAAQNIRGEHRDYGDLEETYQITIFSQDVFDDDAYFHCFELYDPARGIAMGGKTRVFTVELSKLAEIAAKDVASMTALERWAVFMQYRSDAACEGKIAEIVEQEEGIKMANVELSYITGSEAERLRLYSEVKRQLDFQSEMAWLRKEGLREGRAEGLKEGMEKGLKEGMRLVELERANTLAAQNRYEASQIQLADSLRELEETRRQLAELKGGGGSSAGGGASAGKP